MNKGPIPKFACPFCACGDSRVLNSRMGTFSGRRQTSGSYWRRRQCLGCGQRYTTEEQVRGHYSSESSTHRNM